MEAIFKASALILMWLTIILIVIITAERIKRIRYEREINERMKESIKHLMRRDDDEK